jgi:excisionase family DNA binding protein
MDIKQTADELGISVRHVRRLIKSGQIPATKVRMQKIVEVNAWEIPDEVVEAAKESMGVLLKYENFGEWMVDTTHRLGLSMQDLAKRTKLPMSTLEYIMRMSGYLSASDQHIEDAIGKVLMRADIERRCADG